MTTDWHASVYHKNDTRVSREKQKQWNILRRQIIYRDRNRCLRCDKKFPAEQLSVHHLVPRSDDGSDEPSNLVTLCNGCHDFVEIENLKTISTIIGSMDNPAAIEGKASTEPTDWHAWVYGGQRNPLLDRQ